MNKKILRPIFFCVLSNALIYFMIKTPPLETKPNIILRENLTTMQIPIRSYYKWESSNLISGGRGEILSKNGEMLIPNVYVYTDEAPSSEKTLIVTIQTSSPIPLTINKNLKDDDFFILSKRSTSKITKEKNIEELFF